MRRIVRRWTWGPFTVLCCLAASNSVLATTKGLSQIVTPDVQPAGELSLSVQAQSRDIGNPRQLQAELGLTRRVEVAVSQGLSPGQQIFGTQLALIQSEPYLLTTGFINWSSGSHPQPFLEGGYFTEHEKFVAGPIRVGNRTEALLGWAHDFSDTWRFQLDYQGGADNFLTVGFTCNVTSRLQFNPALYLSNDHPHRRLGYVVFSYTLPLWKP
jgi:hypothetical protein